MLDSEDIRWLKGYVPEEEGDGKPKKVLDSQVFTMQFGLISSDTEAHGLQSFIFLMRENVSIFF